MDANEYQRLAMRTAVSPSSDANTKEERLLNAALGMCGEAGEFADAIKKARFQGHCLNEVMLAKELGDVLWYAALACEALGVSLGRVMEQNLEKLERRYRNGFSFEASINRED